MPGPEQKLLSVVQAAMLIGVSPYTLRTWLRQRRLAHVRLGRRILFAPSDLQNFIDANRIAAKGADPRH